MYVVAVGFEDVMSLSRDRDRIGTLGGEEVMEIEMEMG